MTSSNIWDAEQDMEEYMQQMRNAARERWGYKKNNVNENIVEAMEQEGILRKVSKKGTFSHLPIPENTQKIIHSMLTGIPESATKNNRTTIENQGFQYLKEKISGAKVEMNIGPLPYGPTERNFVGGANANNNNNNNYHRFMLEQQRNGVHINNDDDDDAQGKAERNQDIRNAIRNEASMREVSKEGTIAHLPLPPNLQRNIHSMVTGIPPSVGAYLKPNNTRKIENIAKIAVFMAFLGYLLIFTTSVSNV